MAAQRQMEEVTGDANGPRKKVRTRMTSHLVPATTHRLRGLTGGSSFKKDKAVARLAGRIRTSLLDESFSKEGN
jgi:hypothetical protein